MTPRAAFAAVSLIFSAAAFGQASPPPASGDAPQTQSCDHRKFETRVATEVDGKIRSSTVRICGVAGQSEADWKRTLEDSARKVEANEKMAADVKEQIVSALKLEIANLEAPAVTPLSSQGSAAVSAIPEQLQIPAIPAPLTPVRPGTSPARPLERDYGNLKPLPPPLPPAAVTAVTASMMPRLTSPRLTLLCSAQYDPHGTEECNDLYPSTIITVRADERLASDTSLRFVRKGTPRGDVKLAALGGGQAMRVRLPSSVCSGVTRGTVEIQVMRQPRSGVAQVVDAYGPYDLRC
jgi:hypothetical protein